MRKIKEVDLDALAPSPECPADQIQKVKLVIPEVWMISSLFVHLSYSLTIFIPSTHSYHLWVYCMHCKFICSSPSLPTRWCRPCWRQNRYVQSCSTVYQVWTVAWLNSYTGRLRPGSSTSFWGPQSDNSGAKTHEPGYDDPQNRSDKPIVLLWRTPEG